MSERLGAWKNAPLAYVLAEVRTELLADLKNYQPDLAAAFRGEFPVQRTLVTARIIATPAGVPSIEPEQDNAWEFATPDNHIGLILRPQGFVLHATKYKDHADFLDRFDRALKLIAERIPSIYVNRLGLRYVDFVIPKQGEIPEDYVDQRLNPQVDLPKVSGSITAMSLAVYPMTNGRLTLRYMRGAGQPQLPPELSTIALEKSALMQVPAIDPGQLTAILDIDRTREFTTRELLDPLWVHQQLQAMRDEISESFKERIITKHAREIWGAEQ